MIAAGFGCRPCCTALDIRAALELALQASGVALGDVRGLFSIELLAAAPALRAAAEALDEPLVLLPLERLVAMAAGALTRSERVIARFGVPSIAETAALAGAIELGAGGMPRSARLLAPRLAAGAATCALARLTETT